MTWYEWCCSGMPPTTAIGRTWEVSCAGYCQQCSSFPARLTPGVVLIFLTCRPKHAMLTTSKIVIVRGSQNGDWVRSTSPPAHQTAILASCLPSLRLTNNVICHRQLVVT